MTQPGRPARSPARWAAVSILLAIAVAGPLLVPIYARTGPKLGAFPFFYWYQLMWIPLIAVLVTAALAISQRAGKAAREDSDA